MRSIALVKGKILALLADGEVWTVAAIAERTGMPVRSIANSARRLADQGTLERRLKAGRFVYWLAADGKGKKTVSEKDVKKVLALLADPMTVSELALLVGRNVARRTINVLKKRGQIHVFSWTAAKSGWHIVWIAGAGENLSLQQFQKQREGLIERAKQIIFEHVEKKPGIAKQDLLKDLKHVPHVNAAAIAGLVARDQLKRVTKGKSQMLYISDHKKNIERCSIWDAATRVAVQRRIAA